MQSLTFPVPLTIHGFLKLIKNWTKIVNGLYLRNNFGKILIARRNKNLTEQERNFVIGNQNLAVYTGLQNIIFLSKM